jgi:hypothetical protein
MGGQRHSAKRLRFSLEIERVLKDDELAHPALASDEMQLEYYEDDYPKLPASSDRRPPPDFAQLREDPLTGHESENLWYSRKNFPRPHHMLHVGGAVT